MLLRVSYAGHLMSLSLKDFNMMSRRAVKAGPGCVPSALMITTR
jgi:hypothetical protein